MTEPDEKQSPWKVVPAPGDGKDRPSPLASKSPPRSVGATFAALAALVLGTFLQTPPAQADAVEDFLDALRVKVSAAEKVNRSVIAGKDGWLFFVPELRSLSVGPFWGERATAVSRSSKPEYADPLPAIVDFHEQLKKADIELLVVPVPAKAAAYPERLAPEVGLDASQRRCDPRQQEFYELLGKRGVNVIDLLPLFVEHRDDPAAMYCRTDTHWSGAAVALAAQAIADRVRDRPWLKDLKPAKYDVETREQEISGDLARLLDESQPARERLSLSFVGVRRGGALVPIEPERDSPVLLMGDSHTLVFHDPELFARGAGLPDHLALRLGMPVDLLGVRGSGATTTRIELLRRRDNLKGKKLVIWCFSFREFTESFTGWRKVPVIRE
jgi:acetyltransferase AlgX (SGNH hydrolase-like protein)